MSSRLASRMRRFIGVPSRLLAGVRGQPIDPARVLAIGDSAHTDIKGGEAQGFDTLFITSGIHRAELHAPNRSRPRWTRRLCINF